MSAWRASCGATLVCALITSAIAASGCTTLRPVSIASVAGTPASSIHTGDQLRLTLRDGRRVKLTVGGLEATAIVARFGARYELNDILTVERQELNKGKTGLLVAGLVGGALFLYIAVAAGNAYGTFLGGR
jgi:hypothetical protein